MSVIPLNPRPRNSVSPLLADVAADQLASRGSIQVEVRPEASGLWCIRFSDSTDHVERGALTKETAVQLGAEAVLIWNATLTVQNTPMGGAA